jgi:hypothetical protein
MAFAFAYVFAARKYVSWFLRRSLGDFGGPAVCNVQQRPPIYFYMQKFALARTMQNLKKVSKGIYNI